MATELRETQQAKTSIVIFCDFPAYGRFSNLQAFTGYKTVLERKRSSSDVSIHLTCLSPKQRALAIQQQFEKSLEKKPRSKKFVQLLRRFLDDYGADTDNPRELDLKRFSELAEEANTDMVKEVFPKKDCLEVDQPIHIFFWLIDSREAIFSVVSRSEKALEHGFFTRDARLIEAFEAMRTRYQNEQRAPGPGQPPEGHG
ncbi:MAG: hypothetical protein WAM82_16025 [Thermoanaerobaculia bacterium]